MTTQSKNANPVKHNPHDDDVQQMNLYERLWHVQSEADAANGGSKAYNGTYAPSQCLDHDSRGRDTPTHAS